MAETERPAPLVASFSTRPKSLGAIRLLGAINRQKSARTESRVGGFGNLGMVVRSRGAHYSSRRRIYGWSMAPWCPYRNPPPQDFANMSHHIPINNPIEDTKDTSKHFEEGAVDQDEQHPLQQFDPKLRKRTMLKVGGYVTVTSKLTHNSWT